MYICHFKMRTYLVYFLTGLFLFFVIGSKIQVTTLRNDYSGPVSHHMPKHANRLNQTFEKLSVQQQLDDAGSSSFEFNENDFQLSDTVQAVIVFACVFSLLYIFGLRFRERLKLAFEDLVLHALLVKKYIFIRSIRI
ncbi:hypothetical protein SAMN05421664_0746 [Chryseobacterium soldanellicola]|uniref:Uncharacterized protein n=2 Tax=Chryseobacterium soldanellicola TaxID=311333 RepID=A0A1H0YJ78_9FLAO|nr:hypothetical protein SAMN05421664_0746 [Chryseobacterium soldanellicola]